MLLLQCQACGRSERIDDRPKGDKEPNEIQAATVTIREPWPGQEATADLCPRCRARLLGEFFGVVPGAIDAEARSRDALLGPPEMPRYLEPSA